MFSDSENNDVPSSLPISVQQHSDELLPVESDDEEILPLEDERIQQAKDEPDDDSDGGDVF
jgi:hypothetical protein